MTNYESPETPGNQPPVSNYGQPPPYQQAYGQPPPYQPVWSAPRPGCIPLRPLGVGDILDGSFRVIKRNPRTTLGFSAVIGVVQACVLAGFQLLLYKLLENSVTNNVDGSVSFDVGAIGRTASTGFSALILSVLFGAILTGMLTLVVTDDVLGQRASLGDLWRRARPRLPRLIGLSMVVGVVQFIGLLFLLGPGIWLWGIWAVAVPAFMVENLGTVAALRRSRALVRGTFWRVWGIRALGFVIVSVLSGILTIPFSFIAAAMDGGIFGQPGQGLPVARVLIGSIGSILTVTFTYPLRAGIDALLYTDLRMRKEGLDLALQQRHAVGPPR